MTKSHRRPLRRTHLELRLRVPEIPITHARTVHLRTDLLADGCLHQTDANHGKDRLKTGPLSAYKGDVYLRIASDDMGRLS